MNTRRLLPLLLCLLLSLSTLTACGERSVTAEQPAGSSSVATEQSAATEEAEAVLAQLPSEVREVITAASYASAMEEAEFLTEEASQEGMSVEEYAKYLCEQHGVTYGDVSSEGAPETPTSTDHTVGSWMLYLTDSIRLQSFKLYYEDGVLVKVEDIFSKSGMEGDEFVTTYEGDTLSQFPYYGKTPEEIADAAEQDYDCTISRWSQVE